MLFSSPAFLFFFLPIVLSLYYLFPDKARNNLLLVASLLFYAWGELYYVLLMLFSIFINYGFGLAVQPNKPDKSRKIVLGIAITSNLLILIGFKYANFITDNINILLSELSLKTITLAQIPLPIGISFFTFQAMSYVIDVYKKEAKVQKNIFDLALYISLFPQLIAGPIVRFHDVAEQIRHRVVSFSLFFSGTQRFVYGLAKKMLIANPLGAVADQIFSLAADDLSMGTAWLGIFCYTLQIYFDFSGYSDMAIGLGRMFGFRFLENFNYPYISRSIQEFWRRWHISLSSWFRDYLYIPLGGNRKGSIRTYVNLLTVFFLCGLWHGSSWNFIIWGLFHGCFLMIERMGLGKFMSQQTKLLQHGYALLAIMVGWVFFRAETISSAWFFLQTMFNPIKSKTVYPLTYYLTEHVFICLILGIVLATPIWSNLNKRWINQLWAPNLKTSVSLAIGHNLATTVYLSFLTLCCFASIAANTYNPFIYFRF
ncbi:MAG: MBOAT family protein [Methylococcales bacterium]|nr:MBOAT family protein [Methylococcales bacterium]